jgi:hypothetical protein
MYGRLDLRREGGLIGGWTDKLINLEKFKVTGK